MSETTDHTAARLLPWEHDNKPAFLVTDAAGTSPLTRLADRVEASQLGNAKEVLRLSGLPEMDHVDAAELRWVVDRLRESLVEVLRISESRGMRLPVPDDASEITP